MIDRSVIVKAALDLIRTEGIEKLTMRSLAAQLNIKGASLYWHIRNKNELLALSAEEVCKQIHFPDELDQWREQLFEFGKRYRHTLLEIRNSAHVLAATPPTTPYRLHLIDKVSSLFEKAGFRNEDIFSAGWMFNNYVCGFVIDEYRLVTMDKESADIPDLEREFTFGMKVLMEGFASLLK